MQTGDLLSCPAMKRMLEMSVVKVLALVSALVNPAPDAVAADVVRVAVASNFAPAVEAMRGPLESSGDLVISVSAASTGKLYAQIRNGAPFDVFLAADVERPMRLERDAQAVAGSRFTYAQGRLVLWSRDEALSGADCLEALQSDPSGRIAIANPRTAPYGEAARDVLFALGLWQSVQPRLALAENISQALQFAASGSARFGFVAASQLGIDALPPASCMSELPARMHEPILQQAVLLSRAAGNPAAEAFIRYLKSEPGRAVIAAHGYRLPDID